MGILKAQGLKAGKTPHVSAFRPSTSEDSLWPKLWVRNSVLKLGPDRPWRAVTQDRVIMCCCPETLAKWWLWAIPARGGHCIKLSITKLAWFCLISAYLISIICWLRIRVASKQNRYITHQGLFWHIFLKACQAMTKEAWLRSFITKLHLFTDMALSVAMEGRKRVLHSLHWSWCKKQKSKCTLYTAVYNYTN